MRPLVLSVGTVNERPGSIAVVDETVIAVEFAARSFDRHGMAVTPWLVDAALGGQGEWRAVRRVFAVGESVKVHPFIFGKPSVSPLKPSGSIWPRGYCRRF